MGDLIDETTRAGTDEQILINAPQIEESLQIEESRPTEEDRQIEEKMHHLSAELLGREAEALLLCEEIGLEVEVIQEPEMKKDVAVIAEAAVRAHESSAQASDGNV